MVVKGFQEPKKRVMLISALKNLVQKAH
jgi:hypothetical protein